MKPFFALLASAALLAAQSCPPQQVSDTITCTAPVVGLNTEYWGSYNPTRITNEVQIVGGLPRSQFNLANCHDISCMFYNLSVYHNGARLTPDVDYGRSGFMVVLTVPAVPGDRVVFDYSYLFTTQPVFPPVTSPIVVVVTN